MRVNVGVDLHKGQFTVYWRGEDGSSGRFERYRTTELEYQFFDGKLKQLMDEGHEVRVAVESTGNNR